MKISLDKPKKPRKLTKELADLIIDDVRNLAPKKYAAESNGISDATLHEWIAQGMLDAEHDVDSLYAYIAVSLRNVEKKEIMDCREKAKNAEKGHKGAEWTLEHAYWRSFSSHAQNIELDERMTKLENERTAKKDD